MCGIAGVYLRKPNNLAHVDFSAVSRELLFAIDERGGDACGYVAVDMDGGLQEQKAACPALDFEGEMRPMPDNMRTLLLHTRLATQGKAAFPENNHPVKSGPIRVIHNGVIHNDDKVFEDTGIHRIGRVDSEAIAAVINHYGWDKAMEGLETLKGSFAIAAINEEKPEELLLAKGEWSPLVVAIRPNFIMWASTVSALNYTWKTCIGTIPTWKHVDHLTAGDYIRVGEGGEIQKGRFEAYKRYCMTSYSYNYTTSNDDDYTSWFDRPWDRRTGTIMYYKDGQRYEYNCETQTESVSGEVCDPREHPLRHWINGLVGSHTQTLAIEAGDKHTCAECGEEDLSLLEDYDGMWYCDGCIDFLTTLAVHDAMPTGGVYDREQVDTDDEPDEGTETRPEKFEQCPDCFDYFLITDMVKDANELVCHSCAEIAGQMGSYGVSWRRSR